MDRMAQARKTAKVIERIVMSDRLLFLQIFLYASVKYMLIQLSHPFHVLHRKKIFTQSYIEFEIAVFDHGLLPGILGRHHLQSCRQDPSADTPDLV
jgi:hypothetical protein